MKKERKEKNLFQDMWATTKGKAILKLGMWTIFLGILSILLLFSNNSPETIKKPDTEKITFTEENKLLQELENLDYQYQITITKQEDITTYNGEKKNNLEIGYRESKIGIIKYKIQEGITYQILLEEEAPYNDLYQEEDLSYIKIEEIVSLIDNQKKEEIFYNDRKKSIYKLENVLIEIESSPEKILQINIQTNTKNYKINYQYEKKS